MIDHLLLSYGTSFAIVIRILSSLLLLFFCIPLQIKEAGVKNGLRALRLQLLAFGILLFIINGITIWLLFTVMKEIQHVPNLWLQVINALAFFGIAIIGNRMYHTQYTDEMKEMHEKIADKE
jgi:hypothetical protein